MLQQRQGEERANRAGKGQWSKIGGKKGGTGQKRHFGQGGTGVCENKIHCGKLTNWTWNKSLNDVEEDKGDISEEVHEDEDELHAWCLLEESENEQW